MSFYYPRPTEEHIYEKFEDVDEPCAQCGACAVKRYKALRAHGWHVVERCRECFAYRSVRPTQQSYVPLTYGWPTSSAG